MKDLESRLVTVSSKSFRKEKDFYKQQAFKKSSFNCIQLHRYEISFQIFSCFQSLVCLANNNTGSILYREFFIYNNL